MLARFPGGGRRRRRPAASLTKTLPARTPPPRSRWTVHLSRRRRFFSRETTRTRASPAFRAAMSPADRSAGWRVLEARVGGERVGALLLETRPSGDGAVARRLRNRRNRRDASELAAGSRDRVWVRACWLHPDAARATRGRVPRSSAERSRSRRREGASGWTRSRRRPRERRMGAMPAPRRRWYSSTTGPSARPRAPTPKSA